MQIGSMFPSNYLKKEDVPSPRILTIADVRGEQIDGDNGKETKAVMSFRESGAKPMIVNKGNSITLADAYGQDTDNWRGRPVEVYVDPSVMFGGKRVGGLRVRVPAATASRDQSFGPTWTLDEALATAAHAGLTRDFVLSGLREKGINAWDPARCTPIVQDMIRAATAITPGEQSFETVGADESIPF